MIPIKTVVDKANTKITAGGLTDLEYTQLSSTDVFLDRAGPEVVANFALLPSATNNEGIMYYVTNEAAYYFSDGTYWRKDFSSNSAAITDTPVYAWGQNSNRELGDNTDSLSRLSPVTVASIALTNWTQVAAGATHSLGVTSTGIAYAWGLNSYGRLGDNTTSNRSIPVTVAGGVTNWSQVAAGATHSIGLTSTGIAYAWGNNSYGRLGDNTTVSRSSPVTIAGGVTDWSQVAAGFAHSLALRNTGQLYAWGLNSSGQLGDNTTSLSRSTPFLVVGGVTNWSRVAAGGRHSIGLTSTGIAYAWGHNYLGQLGDNTTVSRSSPVTVVGGITSWSQISAGRAFPSAAHSLGATSTGIAYAWGYNSFGRLGDNTTSNRSSPVTVVGGVTNWSQVAAGIAHSLGLTSTGIAYAWGLNSTGQLGDNTTVSRSSPVTVVGGITSWSQVAAGSAHSLGIFTRTLGTKGFV